MYTKYVTVYNEVHVLHSYQSIFCRAEKRSYCTSQFRLFATPLLYPYYICTHTYIHIIHIYWLCICQIPICQVFLNIENLNAFQTLPPCFIANQSIIHSLITYLSRPKQLIVQWRIDTSLISIGVLDVYYMTDVYCLPDMFDIIW